MSALYEILGPDRNHVIESLTQKFSQKYPKLEINKIKVIVEDHIPSDKTEFGSWRGWSTFGLEKNLLAPLTEKIKILGEVSPEKKNQ